LLEVNRIARGKYQTAAEQLEEANKHLQEAEAAFADSERLAALASFPRGSLMNSGIPLAL